MAAPSVMQSSSLKALHVFFAISRGLVALRGFGALALGSIHEAGGSAIGRFMSEIRQIRRHRADLNVRKRARHVCYSTPHPGFVPKLKRTHMRLPALLLISLTVSSLAFAQGRGGAPARPPLTNIATDP